MAQAEGQRILETQVNGRIGLWLEPWVRLRLPVAALAGWQVY